MLGAVLLTLLPTLLAYFFISKTDLKIKNPYLIIALSWFCGQYLFTIFVFLTALILSPLTSPVLFKASIITILMSILALVFTYSRVLNIINQANNTLKKHLKLADVFIISFCFLFSFIFFIPHLKYQNNAIYTSPIYWDYHWQMSLIQNFVHGDNFPPENEAFAGVPSTYHYF
ncbi:MAG TPA: hypothetical protein VNA13_01425, partial [Xanthomonadales bacterium]|nr:hypothetical protein [Xanthomonadales bacterium]